MNYDDDGRFRLVALLPAEEGAEVEAALAERRDRLFRDRRPRAEEGACPADVSWADALVSMAQRSLDVAASERSDADRHLVPLHLGVSEGRLAANLHLGPVVSDSIRRYLTCDARVRPRHSRSVAHR